MSEVYATPLVLEPDVSHRLGVLLIAIHLGGILCALLVALAAPLKSMLGVWALLSLRHAWRRHMGSQRLVRITWHAGGDWELVTAGGHSVAAHLAPQAYLSPYAVVLYFHLEPRARRALVILQDTLDAETFRRLRVRLRLEAATTPPDRGPAR